MRNMLFASIAVVCLGASGLRAESALENGVQSVEDGDYAAAVEHLEQAVADQPQSELARLHLANALIRLGQQLPAGTERDQKYDRAAELLRQQLEADPNHWLAVWDLGQLALLEGDIAGGSELVQRAADLDPSSARSRYAVGVTAWMQAFPAVMEARRVSGLPPARPGPIPDPALRERLRSEQGPRIENGLHQLEEALRLDSDFQEALLYRNLLLRTSADLASSEGEARQLLAEADRAIARALQMRRRGGPEAELRADAPPPPLPAPPPPPPPPSPSR